MLSPFAPQTETICNAEYRLLKEFIILAAHPNETEIKFV
jgi:hypothetical protein